MPHLIIKKKAYSTKIVNPQNLKILSNPTAIRILNLLSKKPMCAYDVAKILRVHEQKVYYYFKKLEATGVIKKVSEEKRVGMYAKLYKCDYSFVASKISEKKPVVGLKFGEKEVKSIEPFIINGRMNSIIVVGSPDPHGRFGYRASDGYAAIDLALFLGTFLDNASLNYRLDTQISFDEFKKNNLILVGGPKANIWVDKINRKMPIVLDEKKEWLIISKKSGKVYSEDEIGIIIKTQNPYNRKKRILLLTGRRFKGTRASVVAFMKYLDKFEGEEFAHVVMGIDRNSDGIIDDAKIIE